MPLQQKGDISNPSIPEDYYMAELANIKPYHRDNKDATGLILEFDIAGEDDVELPFFAPAKLSVSDDRQSSRLADNLSNIGMLEPVLQELGVKDEVLSENFKWIATDELEAEDLINLIKSAFRNKKVRVNVEDSRDGESSQVSKLSKLFEQENEDGDGL